MFVAHWHNGSFTKNEAIVLKKINGIKFIARNPRFDNDCYMQMRSKRGRRELWRLAQKVCEEDGIT